MLPLIYCVSWMFWYINKNIPLIYFMNCVCWYKILHCGHTASYFSLYNAVLYIHELQRSQGNEVYWEYWYMCHWIFQRGWSLIKAKPPIWDYNIFKLGIFLNKLYDWIVPKNNYKGVELTWMEIPRYNFKLPGGQPIEVP